MTVFLTSSPTGPLDGSRRVDGLDAMNGFAEALRERWAGPARCLIIAAAPHAFAQNDDMADFFAAAFEQSGLGVSCMDLWDARSGETSRQTLHSYDMIVLGGGHVPTQNAFFRLLGLREKLAGFGGLVLGISAGTMNAADAVYAQPELPGEAADPGYVRWLTGLGLTDINVLPHYQMVKDSYLDGKRLFEDITCPDSMGRRFLALPDGSYVLIENGTATLFGEGYEIADGVLTRVCAAGGSVIWE